MARKAATHSPRLKAKGAETRHFVPFGLEVAASMHANFNNSHTITILQCLSSLMDFYMCLGVSPFPKSKAQNACRNTCIFYAALADEAVSNEIIAWKIKPKFHIFQECGEYQTHELGDPQSFWAYQDEDWVGLGATIGRSRGGGGTASTTPERVVQRLRALRA